MPKTEPTDLYLKKFDIKSIVPNATILLLGRRRSGKCLATGTKVMMSDGNIKQVENICQNDKIMGDDMTHRNIVSTTHGTGNLYKVTHLESKETYTVNINHILSLLYKKDRDFPIDIPLCDYMSFSTEKQAKLYGYTLDGSVSNIVVESVGVGEFYGFELDGNNRFVLGNGIITHNSWLVRDIFFNHSDIPSGIIFSGTEEANPFFGSFVPDCFIHSDYDSELVEKVFTRQKKKIREAKDSGQSKDGCLPSNRFFIVLDDMLHEAKTWKNDQTVRNIFFNGRHYNIFFILTMQYPRGIPPELRSNIDYVFVFNEPSISNRKRIFDDFASVMPDFAYFCNVLDSCTKNHECLVIKTSGDSNNIRDQVFYYKAKEHDEFRVGHPKIWQYHDKHYNKHYDEEIDEKREKADLIKKYSKSNKLKVLVSKEGDFLAVKDL